MLHKRQVTELLPAFTVSPSILRALWHYGVVTGMLAFPALERPGDCEVEMPPLWDSFQRPVATRAESHSLLQPSLLAQSPRPARQCHCPAGDFSR